MTHDTKDSKELREQADAASMVTSGISTGDPLGYPDSPILLRFRELKRQRNNHLIDEPNFDEAVMQLIDSYAKEFGRREREETEKAFGGCKKCYGKGYATYSGEYQARGMRWPDESIRYCDCERGKQLGELCQTVKAEF